MNSLLRGMPLSAFVTFIVAMMSLLTFCLVKYRKLWNEKAKHWLLIVAIADAVGGLILLVRLSKESMIPKSVGFVAGVMATVLFMTMLIVIVHFVVSKHRRGQISEEQFRFFKILGFAFLFCLFFVITLIAISYVRE